MLREVLEEETPDLIFSNEEVIENLRVGENIGLIIKLLDLT